MMLTWCPALLANVVICQAPWFQPIIVAWWWNASTKMTFWSGSLKSHRLVPYHQVLCTLAQIWLTLVSSRNQLGHWRPASEHVGKDHWSSTCWWGCSGSWGHVLQGIDLHLQLGNYGQELSSGWSGSGHIFLAFGNGNYNCGWWKLLGACLDATNLAEGDTSGWSNPKICWLKSLYCNSMETNCIK